jgi:long-chain fatty acid transport protein
MKTNPSILKAAWVAALTVGAIGVAHAGGFGRGTADTDLLYEEQNFNMRVDARVVVPHQEYSANANPALVGTNFYGTYIIPSGAVKFNLNEYLRCDGTYTQSNGANTEYADPKFPSGKLTEEFTTDEFGLTCAVRFQAGPGVISVLGGGFIEQLDYDRTTDLNVPTGGLFPEGTIAPLALKGQDYGWRAGIAYEIPDIRLRAQLLYRSGTEYGADGTLVVPGALVGSPAATVTLPAVGAGELPQSLEFSMRSGVAEGWLAFASVKWTDWSVLQNLTVTTPISIIVDQYQWQDGWTVNAGVVHAFSDIFAGQVSLTWDRGVSTGWDLRGDVWTLGLGGRVRPVQIGGEFRGGIGLSWLEGISTDKYADAVIPGDPTSGFNEAADDGYAVTLSAGYIVQW